MRGDSKIGPALKVAVREVARASAHELTVREVQRRAMNLTYYEAPFSYVETVSYARWTEKLLELWDSANEWLSYGQSEAIVARYQRDSASGILDRSSTVDRLVHTGLFMLGLRNGAHVIVSLRYLALFLKTEFGHVAGNSALTNALVRLDALGVIDFERGKRTKGRTWPNRVHLRGLVTPRLTPAESAWAALRMSPETEAALDGYVGARRATAPRWAAKTARRTPVPAKRRWRALVEVTRQTTATEVPAMTQADEAWMESLLDGSVLLSASAQEAPLLPGQHDLLADVVGDAHERLAPRVDDLGQHYLPSGSRGGVSEESHEGAAPGGGSERKKALTRGFRATCVNGQPGRNTIRQMPVCVVASALTRQRAVLAARRCPLGGRWRGPSGNLGQPGHGQDPVGTVFAKSTASSSRWWDAADMGVRYRKSVNLGGGVRLNLNTKSVGLSAGGKGLRQSVNSSGRSTTTVGVPGTGVRWQSSHGGGGSYAQPPSTPMAQPLHYAQAKPGAFAPKAEKQLFKALQQAKNHGPVEVWATTMREVAESEPDYRVAAWSLQAMFLADRDPDTTISCLDALLRQRVDPVGSEFIRKYAPNMAVDIEVAPGIIQTVLLGWDWAAVTASILFEQRGDLEQALAAADALSDSLWARLLRSNLCLKLDRYDRILAMTDGITNLDDLSALLLVLRGVALRNKGENSAALLALKEALRLPSRSAQVRHRARVQRALAYLELGQPAKARQDLDRVLAEDSQFPGLQDALAALSHGSQGPS